MNFSYICKNLLAPQIAIKQVTNTSYLMWVNPSADPTLLGETALENYSDYPLKPITYIQRRTAKYGPVNVVVLEHFTCTLFQL
jgi:hypothetical protein